MTAPQRKYFNDYTHVSNFRAADGGPPSTGLRIYCCECTRSDVRALTQGHATCSQQFADRMFRNKGWTLGRNRKYDICPDCSGYSKTKDYDTVRNNVVQIAAKKLQEKMMPSKTSVTAISAATANILTPAPTLVAEAPREMTRDNRRIIFAKIEDVYIDERTGYSSGWNDQKVATDLGVPLAWVKVIREENFGPEGMSPEARQVIVDAKNILTLIQKEREEIVKAISAHNERAAKLNQQAEQLQRKLAQIERGQM